MKRTKVMFYNLLLLTGVSLIMRLVSLVFNVYVTGKIGAGGIGLYSLIMSVGGFAITFATSGVNLASTRMVAEAQGKGNGCDVRAVMNRCIIYSLCFGISGMIILIFAAQHLSLYVLKDERCILPLRLLALALPFISLSSALSGYFNAVRRVYKSSTVSFCEQFVTIAVTVRLLALLIPKGIGYACAALLGGTLISEFSACLISYILYRFDLHKHIQKGSVKDKHITSKMLSISLPVAFSAYVRSGLVSIEHILIPRGLKRFGSSSDSALAAYGTLHGMVMPVILFPMAIMNAFAGLLVPEIAESLAGGETDRVDNIVERVFHIALIFGIGIAGIMICFSAELGRLIYNSDEAGMFIKIMAPLIPVMYLDHVVDGMLKGMGEQLYSMKVNIFDAAMSVVLVYFVVPVYGVYGYVLVIYAMEIINASLSIVRIFKCSNAGVAIIRWLFKPLVSVIGATSLTKLVLGSNLFPALNYNASAIVGICICTVLYVALLFTTFSVTSDDVKWFKVAVR